MSELIEKKTPKDFDVEVKQLSDRYYNTHIK